MKNKKLSNTNFSKPQIRIPKLNLNSINSIKLDSLLQIFLIILVSFFYFSNLNHGHDWGGDFSMYIMNANNISNKLPYSQTPYIYNETVSDYGPPSYPPIFPLLLSPLIAVFGINLMVLKIPGIICFISFLLIFNAHIIPKTLPHVSRILLLLILGLYPYFFILSESILSEYPFLFFCYLSLLFFNKLINITCDKRFFFTSFITGFLIYITYGIRSIGVILIPILILLALLKRKKITLEVMISVFISILLIIIQGLIIPQTGKYFDQVPHSIVDLLSIISNSALYYLILFIRMFEAKNNFVLSLLFLIMMEGFVVGFINHVRKQISSYDLFFIFYLGILLVWPSYQYLRFLVPVIPLYFLYIIEGYDFLAKKINNRKIKILIPLTFFLFIAINYFQTYQSIFPRPISAIEKPETQELFQFISTETHKEDVILFFKPRVLALFTDRKSLAMRFPDPDGDALGKMEEFGVDIAILNKIHKIEYQPELNQFINSHPQNFDLLFENSEFNVYKVIY